MIVFDVVTRVLDTGSFPQHTIADLSSGIRFIVLVSQEKPLRRKEINTHTHIQVDILRCKSYEELDTLATNIIKIAHTHIAHLFLFANRYEIYDYVDDNTLYSAHKNSELISHISLNLSQMILKP